MALILAKYCFYTAVDKSTQKQNIYAHSCDVIELCQCSHVSAVSAINKSQVTDRKVQFTGWESKYATMIKNERNCADRVDSYILQYRLDRAEVVSTI